MYGLRYEQIFVFGLETEVNYENGTFNMSISSN